MTSISPAAVGNDLFVHNMRALWRVDPTLAQCVDEVFEEDRVPLEPTRSGDWTARVRAADRSMVYLHSRYDPRDEAGRFAAAVPLEDKYCFVISGMGLGYHVRALLDRLTGDRFVVVSEPSIPMIATALTCVDLQDALATRKLVILVDEGKTRLHERLRDFGPLMMLGAQFLRHAPSLRLVEADHTGIIRAISDFITYTRMTLVTLVANSRITCRNIAMNIGTYVTTPPIDLLHGRFAGNPAIIVSAGPSLRKNIDQLGGLKGRAVLCAVQTAIKPLVQRGIKPDFVTSLDYHEMSRKFFEEAGDLSDVHLVAEPKATWHVLDQYPGPVSLLDNHWARLLLGDALAGRGGLKAGATVAHLAFYLAVHLGCDPIIFVGQDLAFTGHVFYVPGVEIHQSWRGELNRFSTMETKEWERIVRNRPMLRKVRGADGGEWYSDELLFTYLEQFEADIAGTPRTVINATEGGAMIRGTQVMALRAAAERWCTRPIDPQRFAYRVTTTWREPSPLEPAAEQIEQRLSELGEAIGVCEELLALFQELEGLTGDPKRFNQRLVRVDELRAKVYAETRAYQLINSFAQLAELRRFSADRRLGTEHLADAERAQRQLRRDTEFITAVHDGAVELTKILTEARGRLRLKA